MESRPLAKNLSVSGQITPADLPALAQEGFTDIVCNRPDQEHPDGPVSDVMAAAAARIGLGFHYLPIVPGEHPATQADRLSALTSRPGVRVFAYCRSGARAEAAWKLAEEAKARSGVDSRAVT